MEDIGRLFANQAFTNVLSALLGAVVGSLTGYLFNRQLEKSRTRERYLIQRKNTIYSPIYKELLALKSYLEGALKGYGDRRYWRKHTIQIEFSDRDRHNSFNFYIWENIKRDVRKSYIDPAYQSKLEKLTKKIRDQHRLQNAIDKDVGDVAEMFMKRNASSHKEIQDEHNRPNTKSNLIHVLSSLILPYSPDQGTKSALIDALKRSYEFDDKKADKQAELLLKEVRDLQSFRSLEPKLKSLIRYTDTVAAAFEKVIEGIINKYEGGIKVE